MTLIHTIDLHYLGMPELIACYVVVGAGGPVLIETGPNSTLEALERGLDGIGFSLDDIEHALVTHIHLDHAGAAGDLARRGVKVYVHEFGARHLIEPTKLLASAERIYGDKMDRLWGRITPAPEGNIIPVTDNQPLDLAGLHFTALETPGHARHHLAFALMMKHGSVCFTGDAAGMIIPGLRFINLPTPPPEFDLTLWMQSIERLERSRFNTLYLTHFGAIHTPLAHLTAVKQSLRSHVEYIRARWKLGEDEPAITEAYAKWVNMQARRAGASDQLLSKFLTDNLLRMNVTGIVRYLSTS